MPRYTKSVDGKMRTTIRPDSLRLTKEEFDLFDKLAKQAGYAGYREWLNYEIVNLVVFSFEKLNQLAED